MRQSQRRAVTRSLHSLGYLVCKVEKRAVDGREPVRHSLWNHNHVALGQMTRDTARRGFRVTLSGRSRRLINCGPAGHKSRRAFHHVENVRIVLVDFDRPSRHSASG